VHNVLKSFKRRLDFSALFLNTDPSESANTRSGTPQTFKKQLIGNNALPYLFVWLLINLVTAASTELYSDEAYYWVFSRFLDWGYLDHPPMIAAIIKLGTLFGDSEVGVRIIPILLSTGALWLLYRLSQPVPAKFFFVTVFSMLSLNLVGFMSVPDVPLLFFAVLFYYCYKGYLEEPSTISGIILGVVVAALIYSKYHGILIIFFTILSNPGLLKQSTFYLAAGVALILLFPHILWQVQNDYPSLQYHLVDRGASTYKLIYTLDYLLGNIPYHGPWASLVLLVAAFSYNSKDLWAKALKWNLIGTLIFFLLTTSKGYVQANWTLLIVVPLLVLGFRKLMQWTSFHKIYLRMCYVFLVAIVAVRALIISPLASIKIERLWEFQGAEQFATEVFDQAGDLPVVANSYQDASLLSFYGTGDRIVPSLNINSRSNQFDLWALDGPLCGESVLFANNYLEGDKVIGRKLSQKILTLISSFPPVAAFEVKIVEVTKKQSDLTLVMQIHLTNTKCLEELKGTSLKVDLWKDNNLIKTHYENIESLLRSNSDQHEPITLLIGQIENQPDHISLSVYFEEFKGTTNTLARKDL